MQRLPGSLPTVRTSLAHDIDRAAQPILLGELPSTWIRNEVAGGQDYGLDYLVETVESHAPSGVRFGIQLKGIKKPRITEGTIRFPFPTKNLGTYLLTELLPVFLVVGDVTAKRAYFLFLQRFADEHLVDEDWADQEDVTVRVPLENRVCGHEALRQAVHEARNYMLAERSSPSMSLAHRRAAMERLDPRFIVRPTATEQGENYELSAKVEGVRFGMSFAGLDPERRGLLRRGHVVPVAHGEITFRDLPIVEHFARQMVGFQIAANVDCTATVQIERDGVTADLVNLPTKVTMGIDEIRVAAAYTNAPMAVNVTLTLLEPKATRQATVAVDVQHAVDERWFGQRIDQLAHFDRIHAVGELAAQPYRLRMLLHIPGVEDLEVPWGGPIGQPTPGVHEYDKAMAALRLARETSRLLGIFPRVPKDVLIGGYGDVELIHALLTVGEHEGDGSSAVFQGHMPAWNDYVARLAAAKKNIIDFDASGGVNDCFWNFLGQKVNVPVGRMTLSNARCTVTSQKDGMIEIIAKGTPGSRFWVERAAAPSAR